jgi:NADP-dependent 3-hydroxy acid dehydrogenase YdfG
MGAQILEMYALYLNLTPLSKPGEVAAGARRMDRLKSLQSEIIKNGGEVFVQKLDVTIKSECDAFANAVMKKWGTIDIPVNNAGLQPLSFFKNLQVEEWDKMIDINIKGVLYCTALQYNTPMLNKKSGHIVNISSIAEELLIPPEASTILQSMLLPHSVKVCRQKISQMSSYLHCRLQIM